MARAIKGTRVLKRVTKKTVPTVNLELTEGEADFLQAVLCKISGDGEKSPRKYQQSISKALAFATGQRFTETDAYKLLRLSGGIHFKDYPGELKAPFPGTESEGSGVNVEAAMNYMRHHKARMGVYGDVNGIPDGREKRDASPTYAVFDELGPASRKSDYWPIDDDGHRRP